MSQLLNDYRAKYPEYDDLSDDQLVTGLHAKYQSVAPDMTLDDFKTAIEYQPMQPPALAQVPDMGYQEPQPIQQRGVPQAAQPKSMMTRVNEKLLNMGAGGLEAGGDALGLFLDATRTLSKPVDEYLGTGGIGFEKGSYLPTYFTAEEMKRRNIPNYSDRAAKSLRNSNFGYIEQESWDDVKKNYSDKGLLSLDTAASIAEYGFEAGVKSVPEMAMAMTSLPAYILTNSQRMGEARAQNSGRDKATAGDVLTAAPFAYLSGKLEQIMPQGLSGAMKEKFGQEMLQAGFANAAKRITAEGGKGLTREAATEAIQNGMIEYVGERLGTDAQLTFAESLDQALAGAVAGGVFGGVAGAGAGTYRELNNLDQPQQFRIDSEGPQGPAGEPSKAVVQAVGALAPVIDQQQFGSTEELARNAFNPANAQVQIEKPPQIDVPVQMPRQEPQLGALPDNVHVKFEPKVEQKVTGKAIVEAPLNELTLSKDIPQFKSGANAKGVTEPLGGTFDRQGVGPIQVWVRKDGRKEVISGRHRLDLAQRSGETTIPAQYHYESEGFDRDQATMLDALLNIREGQGKVKDYVEFIKGTELTREEADAQGILARQTGRRAYTVATQGSDALIASHRNDDISDEAAERIAKAAPNDEMLQALGLEALNKGRSITYAENLMQALSTFEPTQGEGVQGDLFGFDDAVMKEAARMAEIAAAKQQDLQKSLSAIRGAAKSPELARKQGVDVKDPDAVKARIKDLSEQKKALDNWATNPALTQVIKAEANGEAKPAPKRDLKQLKHFNDLPQEFQKKVLDARGNSAKLDDLLQSTFNPKIPAQDRVDMMAAVQREISAIEWQDHIPQTVEEFEAMAAQLGEENFTPEQSKAGKDLLDAYNASVIDIDQDGNVTNVIDPDQPVFKTKSIEELDREFKGKSVEQVQELLDRTKARYAKRKNTTRDDIEPEIIANLEKWLEYKKSQKSKAISWPSNNKLTEKEVDNLDYTNGIQAIAAELEIQVDKHEHVSSIRDKIKKKLGIKSKKKYSPEDYTNYPKDDSKPQYHGTQGPIQSLDEYTYAHGNFYGQGLYTTDSMNIADGYAKARKAKEPTIYRIELKKKPKLYDMEQPITEDLREFIQDQESDYLDNAMEESSTLRGIYDAAREYGTAMGASSDLIQEDFTAIQEYLESQGYDGLRHVGGSLTNHAPHNVEIYFNPPAVLDLVNANEEQSKPLSIDDVINQANASEKSLYDQIPIEELREGYKKAQVVLEEVEALGEQLDEPSIQSNPRAINKIHGQIERKIQQLQDAAQIYPKRNAYDWNVDELAKNYTPEELAQWGVEIQTNPDNWDSNGDMSLLTRLSLDAQNQVETLLKAVYKGMTGNDALKTVNAPVQIEKQKSKPAKQAYAVQDFKLFINQINEGNLKQEDVLSNFNRLIDNKESILQELNSRAYTKDDLVRMTYSLTSSGSNDKKSVLADRVWRAMVNAHIFKDSITYRMMDGESFESQMKTMVEAQTQADIDAWYTLQANRAEVQQQRRAAQEKVMNNPETLDEYKMFIRVHGKAKLSQEQLAKYDEMMAESLRPEDKPTVIKSLDKKVEYTRHETIHAKKGHELWVVSLVNRLGKEQYEDVLGKAKALNGYYSTYTKNGAIAGFQFQTKAEADSFAAILDDKNVDVSDFAEAKADLKKASQAEKLADMANKIEEKANESLSSDRQTNTAKRAREAGYAREKALKEIAFAQTLRKISAGIGSGDINHLGNITAVTQLDNLYGIMRSFRPTYDKYRGETPQTLDEYIHLVTIPKITLVPDQLKSIVAGLKGKRGYTKLVSTLVRISNMTDGKWHEITIDEAKQIEFAKKKNHIDPNALWYVKDKLDQIKRLEAIGITTDSQLRAALRELNNLDVKKESLVDKTAEQLRELEESLIGTKIDSYFPTPPELVERMITIADIEPTDLILEPSAGKGNIADGIVSLYPDIQKNIKVIEPVYTLRQILELKGYDLVDLDFMTHEGTYDKIIMNPPFENGQDIDHVRHAYDLLKPNGTLVAIMGAGVKNSRKKSKDFIEWLDAEGGVLEDLPEGSFKSSERSTGVATVLVTLHKPDAGIVNMDKGGLPSKDVYSSEAPLYPQGVNSLGSYNSLGLPPRQEQFKIDGVIHYMPEEVQRHEPILETLVSITGPRIYFGKLKLKSNKALGFYRPKIGELRTKKANDIEILAHELAHYLDMYSNTKLPNFSALYKDKRYVDEVMALSYTSANPDIQKIEGFAEFIRFWATWSNYAMHKAPRFYKAFENKLQQDQKLYRKMKKMQLQMHQYYLQGPDKLGQAKIGKKEPFSYTFAKWSLRRNSRIRQQMIDRNHAARRIQQDLTGSIGKVSDSAWKQLRIANGGYESITDSILNYGTVNFDKATGDLVKTGKGLHEILAPVNKIKLEPEHKNDTKIDLLMRYFAGKRALELLKQKREQLIHYHTAKEWIQLEDKYPVFKSIHAEFQEFNDRMLDFYVSSGILSEKAKKAFREKNKDYVPFFRVRETLDNLNRGPSGGFHRLKGGSQNLRDLLLNITEGVETNVRAALINKAKQKLYSYMTDHQDGAYYAVKIKPDAKPVKVMKEQLTEKIKMIFESLDLKIEDYYDIDEKGNIDFKTMLDGNMQNFWQFGIKPTLSDSSNMVDYVLVGGKPKYYEVQDAMLQEMLLGMNPASYGAFMRAMFMIKNGFTRAITMGAEFSGANLARDTLSAAYLSKGKFIPLLSSFSGMYSYITQDEHFQELQRNGGAYSSRIEGLTNESRVRSRVRLKEFGANTALEKMISSFDAVVSAFEYGTRLGEFKIAKRQGETSMDASFRAREISTDFSVTGANTFLTGYVRTVPFLNAMVQSQDRVYREIAVSKKYDGNPRGFAMMGFLTITLPTLALWLFNKDDEEYKAITDAEKRTNWHVKLWGQDQYIKIPRPYDIGFVFATIPELFMNYIEKENGREYAEGMAWTMLQMYGIDGVPAAATGWWDLVRNKKWTGAPVVPMGMEQLSPINQYNANTSESFIRLGQALGVSPIQAEHFFTAYTGYLGGYLLHGSDLLLWDEEKFGPMPSRRASDSPFLKRFITPEVRSYTGDMERFYKLKEESDQIYADFRRKNNTGILIKEKGADVDAIFREDPFFGFSTAEKRVLFSLNKSMKKVMDKIYGDKGILNAELAIRYDNTLTAEEKRTKLESLWKSQTKLFNSYMDAADTALKNARAEVDQ